VENIMVALCLVSLFLATLPTRYAPEMSKALRFLFVSVAVLAPFAAELMAQPVGGPPPCWPPPCIPIDGGVGALFLAGALLGGRKAAQLRKARRNQA
jgi:hypothetical protein